MQKPKMILFDYGQTLADEGEFQGVRGTEAVLRYAVKNPGRRTAEEVQRAADQLNRSLGRFGPASGHMHQVEIPNHMFNAYLYESLGIELSLSPEQIDEVFWNTAAPGKPTAGIEDFLMWLKEQGIRSGVITNISYAPDVVKRRIRKLLPGHSFEFILATSEYLFRKPDRRIFELALKKAELEPEEVWYAGDSYECDVMGAKNVGIFPVWYVGAAVRPVERREDVWMVSSWEEIKAELRIQLKCTSALSQYTDRGDVLAYKLKVKNYNDLCLPSTTPIILGLLVLPENEKEWLSWSKEELLIKGCMYWTEFSGSSESENAGSVTITIDKRQVLNVETLNQILEKIAREEWP